MRGIRGIVLLVRGFATIWLGWSRGLRRGRGGGGWGGDVGGAVRGGERVGRGGEVVMGLRCVVFFFLMDESRGRDSGV